MRYYSLALILFVLMYGLASGEDPARPSSVARVAPTSSDELKQEKKAILKKKKAEKRKRNQSQIGQYSTVPIFHSANFEKEHSPPSDDEVTKAWERSKASPLLASGVLELDRQNLRIVKEKIADYLDPPHEVPLIGPVQLHHSHYKCTIYYSKIFAEANVVKDVRDVVYIDYNHFHLMPESAIAVGLKASNRR